MRVTSRTASVFLTFIATLLLTGLSTGAASPAPLESQIDQLISEGALSETIWGIDIRDAQTGQQIYGHQSGHLLMPASTNKLLTSATALQTLGTDYRYRTTLYFDGDIDGNTLRGNLIIRGSGDPTLGSVEVEGRDPLRQWAQRLARMGVTRIEGRLIGDDDAFTDNPYAEGWDIDYLTTQASRWLGISTSGLAYHDNVVKVRITASSPGESPRIFVQPTNHIEIRNRATTGNYSRGSALNWERGLGRESITFSGSVSRGFDGTLEMPVTNPTKLTVHSFKKYLQEAGIEVGAPVRDVDELDQALDYEDADPIFVHLSSPLRSILDYMNRESNNFYAEQVFRTFSPDGSLDGSARRVKALLRRAGANADPLSIRDGSGLSRKDLVTAAAMSKMLVYMTQQSTGDAFRSIIARGGEPESTLRYRLRNLPVRAKTGSLAYVRALSGYADMADGRTVAFTLFANNYTVPSYRITQTLDRIVQTLVTSSIG